VMSPVTPKADINPLKNKERATALDRTNPKRFSA